MKVEIYSDIACPWCHVGKNRFERALAAFPGAEGVEVVYRPFQLDPGAPEKPLPHREVLAEKYGPQSVAMDDRITAIGEAEGLTFDFDTVVENNSLLAHRLLRFVLGAYGPAAQARLKGRLLEAHFGEGLDIGDAGQLADAAVTVGLEREPVAAFLGGDDLRDEVLAEIDEGRRRGVTAVPTFVFEGQWAVQGGQDTETFLRVLEQVAEATGAAAPEAGESCADGACEVPATGRG
ncbi:DsbA family oxidoreductase [Streptomyces sp. HU2014]|uniref:DsbA family oxidoreductase n=1 Tax=Streptomyces sp. HU2014 TaxID=2939414 RepID=UPI00200EE364|nr:DsbA family oxidoreductase [Streptomyces sp. HU2014]UQI43948.1 DsbA family oxidoreductase [Streptomyces sp. HU2014]